MGGRRFERVVKRWRGRGGDLFLQEEKKNNLAQLVIEGEGVSKRGRFGGGDPQGRAQGMGL